MKHSLFAVISILIACLNFKPVSAQHSLPKKSILADSGIREITVFKTPIGTQNIHEKKMTKYPDKQETWKLVKYFLNPAGFIDSVYHFYPNDSNYHEKDVLKYDSISNIVETKKILRDGTVKSRILIEPTASGNWHYRSWENNLLKYEKWFTKDSIVVKRIIHRGTKEKPVIWLYTFDLETDIRTETWYDQGVITHREVYQWITENDIPVHFIHTIYNRSDEGKKPEIQTIKLPMTSEGVPINKRNGTIFDPYRMDGYFDRFETFGRLSHAHNAKFHLDSIVTELEVAELWTFDGTEIVYMYQFEYEY